MESILTQTYRDFEFLIINDCSTDDSLETIRSFGDARIREHTNEQNMGQTKRSTWGCGCPGYTRRYQRRDDYPWEAGVETQSIYL
jgi:GT2 family glycosyltransferase